VNITVAVEAPLREEPVLVRGGISREAVLPGISERGMAKARVVAGLAKLGHLTRQKVVVIASMGLVAGCAVLCNRRMFKGKGTSLLRVAFVTEVRPGIGLYHLRPEAAVDGVTIRTLDLALFNRVTGLSVYLRPHILVAGEAEGGLGGFQAMAHIKGGCVDGMAGVTGDTHGLVFAHIPKSKSLGAVMAGKTGSGLFAGLCLSVKGEDRSFSASISHVLTARTVAGLAGTSCTRAIGNSLFSVDGPCITVIVVLVAILARFSAHVIRDLRLSVHRGYQKKQGKRDERRKT
jgi:hypothetical protein